MKYTTMDYMRADYRPQLTDEIIAAVLTDLDEARTGLQYTADDIRRIAGPQEQFYSSKKIIIQEIEKAQNSQTTYIIRDGDTEPHISYWTAPKGRNARYKSGFSRDIRYAKHYATEAAAWKAIERNRLANINQINVIASK